MNSRNTTSWKQEGSIGILQLHNPPGNYLTIPEFFPTDELQQKVNNGIKGLIITGSGRHFSAGADLKMIKKQLGEIHRFRKQLTQGNELLNFIETMKIPVMAAITGACFGGGLEVALSCHVRVCSKTALFAFPEVNRNLFPGMGGIRKLEEITGKATALELVLKGDLINAEKAHELKLVDRVLPKKEVMNYAVDFLKTITRDRPLKVINSVMASLNNSRKMSFEKAVEKDVEMFCQLALEEFNKGEKNGET